MPTRVCNGMIQKKEESTLFLNTIMYVECLTNKIKFVTLSAKSSLVLL